MEKTIKIQIPDGYTDAVFDKETNEIKFIKGFKLGDKIIIDGIEGYILELDDVGKPTILCSEFLGEMSWYDAMEKANRGPWHLPTIAEWKKYCKIIREIDNGRWYCYWTSVAEDSSHAYYISTNTGIIPSVTKTSIDRVRAFVYVGKNKDTKPRSWEEYRKQVRHTCCFAIDEGGCVITRNRGGNPFVNEFNSEEEAKAISALCKLIQLRDAWWVNWKPNLHDINTKKYCICIDKGDIINKSFHYTYQKILAFPTQEMRDEFLETFRDLIEEAKPLL